MVTCFRPRIPLLREKMCVAILLQNRVIDFFLPSITRGLKKTVYLGLIVQKVCCVHNCVQNFSSLISMKFLLAKSSSLSRCIWIGPLTFNLSTIHSNSVSSTNLLRVRSVSPCQSLLKTPNSISPSRNS